MRPKLQSVCQFVSESDPDVLTDGSCNNAVSVKLQLAQLASRHDLIGQLWRNIQRFRTEHKIVDSDAAVFADFKVLSSTQLVRRLSTPANTRRLEYVARNNFQNEVLRIENNTKDWINGVATGQCRRKTIRLSVEIRI